MNYTSYEISICPSSYITRITLTKAEWLRLDLIAGEVLVILEFGLTLLFFLNIPFLKYIND